MCLELSRGQHLKSGILGNLGWLPIILGVHAARGLGRGYLQRAGSGLPPTLTLMTLSPLFSLPCHPLLFFPPWSPSVSLAVPLATPPQVFLTATHSHTSPFDALEGYICPVLFGSACGGDHHHDNHGGSHGGGGPGAQHSAMPAKSKEELSEGSRKKKTKKAD